MVDKLLGLWSTNKWLFFLLIIPVAIAFIYKILMDANVAGAKQDVKDAEREDAKIRDEQKEAEIKAKIAKEEADKIQDNIDNIEGDENWHKKQE